jgi:Type I restriction enzyme R protein N terminus (HSDR_N)
MPPTLKPHTTLMDFITGCETPNIGAEENRQVVERFLVEQKGYARQDIAVDADLELTIQGEPYRSQVDLVVTVGGLRLMVITCAAGSLGSWERQTVAAARLLGDTPIPLAVISDGRTATVIDAVTGKTIGAGMEAIPAKTDALREFISARFAPLSEERREREALIFRTYDRETVNARRHLT